MQLKNLFTSAVTVAVASALTITTDTWDYGIVKVDVGPVTINSGALWAIIDNAVSIFSGSLTVAQNAGLYIATQSESLELKVSVLDYISSIKNDGIISFDSRSSKKSPSYKLNAAKFRNTGEIYYVAQGSKNTPTFDIKSLDWQNSGFITFYQNEESAAAVHLGKKLDKIENTGDICLYNTVYRQTGRVIGGGTVHIQANSTVFIDNPLSSIEQTFFFEGPGGQLVVSSVGTQDYTIGGFGEGNYIGLNSPVLSYTYDSNSGILSLYPNVLKLSSQDFIIGKGYDANKFRTTSHIFPGLSLPFFNTIVYNGPVPADSTKPNNYRECKSPVPIPREHNQISS